MEKRLKDELERIKGRIDYAINELLCGTKEGYDDSIVGINEAWDIVRSIMKEEIDAQTQ